jgi:coenzyme F420-dependent glucose-6-phosphate dehydrogenase
VAKLGYTLSSEEFGPRDLVEQASRAEHAGFDFLSVSDHFHPWVDAQGHSPFVWATLGGVAQVTQRVEVMTGVSCPTTRIHPAVVAQAAATVAEMMPGRFMLGVGAGENLNEHVVGRGWPEPAVRQDQLEEAVQVIRDLWRGELTSHRGTYFTVEEARIYTVPDEPPPILVATGGERATELAGRIGDGMVGLVPDPEVIAAFDQAGDGGGPDRPKIGQVHVCWARDEGEARRTAHANWPNAAVPGNLNWELRLPSHFESAVETVSEDDVADSVVCGADPEAHISAAREFIDAGYTHVYFHQVGPDQAGFIEFAERELLPRLRGEE